MELIQIFGLFSKKIISFITFSQDSRLYNNFDTEFDKGSTSIQMLPDINSDEEEIDKLVILELIKVAADLKENFIEEGYLKKFINDRSVIIYEEVLQTYLYSNIK